MGINNQQRTKRLLMDKCLLPKIFAQLSGNRNGFFGPVLQTLPDKDEALKLWDSLSQLATSPDFYELKRTRPDGDPDVFSTAKC